jgi:hypothetical protein
MAFSFVHEEFLLGANLSLVLANEHIIIDIDNGNNNLFKVCADKETSIRYSAFKSQLVYRRVQLFSPS